MPPTRKTKISTVVTKAAPNGDPPTAGEAPRRDLPTDLGQIGQYSSSSPSFKGASATQGENNEESEFLAARSGEAHKAAVASLHNSTTTTAAATISNKVSNGDGDRHNTLPPAAKKRKKRTPKPKPSPEDRSKPFVPIRDYYHSDSFIKFKDCEWEHDVDSDDEVDHTWRRRLEESVRNSDTH